MRKLMILAVAGSLLFLGAASLASESRNPFEAAFCPECWEFLWFSGSVDMKGQCVRCGRYPVDLEVQLATWFWCRSGQEWSRIPCAQNRTRHCCTAWNSLAVFEPATGTIREAEYCPAHRSFEVCVLPFLRVRVCPECARPVIRVQATERAWYWCKTSGAWGETPCPMNPRIKCCTKRSGLLLRARPEVDRIEER